MKKLLILAIVLTVALSLVAAPAVVAKGGKNADCTTIQDGTLLDSNGKPLVLGYDQFGYNYQAHMFNGWYDNYSRPDPVYEGTRGSPGETWLAMKWNNAWLSNKDCDEDGLLDRHFGYTSYIGSGAWCTNHMIGWYEADDGNVHQWEWFVKIVAAPADANVVDGTWYAADGTEIGPVIWGAFAEIQSIYNDPYDGYHGVEYLSPAGPGLGKW